MVFGGTWLQPERVAPTTSLVSLICGGSEVGGARVTAEVRKYRKVKYELRRRCIGIALEDSEVRWSWGTKSIFKLKYIQVKYTTEIL